MKPSIGRIVHYVKGAKHLAAIVTCVHSDTCINVYALSDNPWGPNPLAEGFSSVLHDGSGVQDNTWHWPERVE